ncbi:MAG: serine/threonine protein kinase [Muribaculaceae bacterium]|nr:serine/threonine protein kinase [Muribaculaceae bacterium]
MAQGLKKGSTLQGATYRIEEVLGQGTFGITYLATMKEKVSGRLGMMEVDVKVAIKEFFMSDVNGRKADGSTVEGSTGNVFTNYRKRFRKEAENLAHLSHPNIVQVFDVFDENNTSYYAMRFIDGESLDSYIEAKGCLSENEAIAITTEIGRALDYMHSRKMLHLDIKPNNIMRDPDGHHHLIDFGLSKQFSDNGAPETSTSIGLGTPGYAPLEQSSFKQDGSFPATLDIYALGASMYKMLTGKRPSEASILLNEGFPTEELRKAGVSEKTISILQKAMMPGYRNRYQSVREFLKDLDIKERRSSMQGDERTLFEANEDTLIKSGNNEKEAPKVPPVPEPRKPDLPKDEKKPASNKSGLSTALLTIIIIGVAVLVGWLIWKGINSGGSNQSYYDEDTVVVEEAVPVEYYEDLDAVDSVVGEMEAVEAYTDAEENFRQIARSLVTSDYKVYFHGDFNDGKKNYPIELTFDCNQNYLPTSCLYQNVDYKAKVKMKINFIGERMILSGNAGGCDFTISLEPYDDGNWRGTAKNCETKLEAEVWPVAVVEAVE